MVADLTESRDHVAVAQQDIAGSGGRTFVGVARVIAGIIVDVIAGALLFPGEPRIDRVQLRRATHRDLQYAATRMLQTPDLWPRVRSGGVALTRRLLVPVLGHGRTVPNGSSSRHCEAGVLSQA